jgi:CMP/dCMP kinase
MRIAISGHSGCGNTTATRTVGNELDLTTVNYTFRTLAQDLGIDFDVIHRESMTDPLYDYLTDFMLIRAGMREQVVVGARLAAWVVDADLRIWLEAPVEVRAQRIFAREKKGTREAILAKTIIRDRENRQRYLELYGIDIDDHDGFDLTINTHQLSAEQVAGRTVATARWASGHKRAEPNRHVARIRSIIAHHLGIDDSAFTDPALDVRVIHDRIRAER